LDGQVTLSPGSERRLVGVHPDLVRVVRRCASICGGLEFIVTEGLRTLDRQKILLAQGKSRTMHSRHLTGHAVDLAVLSGGEVSWAWPSYQQLAAVMSDAARIEGVSVTWGGLWTSLRDGPHYELDPLVYPMPGPRPDDAQILASAPAAGQPPQA
jgi:peptidoglycan L-alanyl-D-glutamate endopeptidase CwlK